MRHLPARFRRLPTWRVHATRCVQPPISASPSPIHPAHVRNAVTHGPQKLLGDLPAPQAAAVYADGIDGVVLWILASSASLSARSQMRRQSHVSTPPLPLQPAHRACAPPGLFSRETARAMFSECTLQRGYVLCVPRT
ncbi:hypothetical protein HYPSUDRAFT_198754 [Hypholoma sublateritium FD-334 SS-4]|uniref:Uncharacterized protein n=1 Tax=Hypholoma sublateritium (strain FD-334 SS-4) TaxID=945553 RepID=A0A0D2P688_HYPSF|nr:hypothetical protein HYPSUDRAFT_198754 [Hypholoma sublateritium FD-334 SS-4]